MLVLHKIQGVVCGRDTVRWCVPNHPTIITTVVLPAWGGGVVGEGGEARIKFMVAGLPPMPAVNQTYSLESISLDTIADEAACALVAHLDMPPDTQAPVQQ